MPPETRTTQSELIINFLKSAEFEEILKSAVKKEVEALSKETEELRTEVAALKVSNSEVLKLLTSGNNQKEAILINKNNNNSKPVNPLISNKKQPTTKSAQDKPIGQEINLEKNSIQETANNETTMDKGDHTLEDDAYGKWEFPRRRKYTRTRAIYGKAVEETTFKGVTKYIDYHVYRLPPEFMEQDVIEYLNSKGIQDIKCQKMISRYPEEYSSFKVSVSFKQDKVFRNPLIWPEFCVINRFLEKISQKSKIQLEKQQK